MKPKLVLVKEKKKPGFFKKAAVAGALIAGVTWGGHDYQRQVKDARNTSPVVSEFSVKPLVEIPTNGGFFETAFGRQFMPIIENVKNLHKEGKVNVEIVKPGQLGKRNGSRRLASYNPELRKFSAEALDVSDPVFFEWVHEGLHVIDWSNAPEDFQKFQRFLEPHSKMLTNLPGQTAVVSSNKLFQDYVKQFVKKEDQRSYFNSDGSLNLSKARQAFMLHCENYLKIHKSISLVTETHAHLFDINASKADPELFAFFKQSYPSLPAIGFEKFMRIKNSISGLYIAFKGDPLKVSGFIGQHAWSADNFVEQAENALKARGILKKHVDDFDVRRNKLILAAIFSQMPR